MLLPVQVQAILDGCAVQVGQDWSGPASGLRTGCCSPCSPRPGCV
ncbi:phage integrase family domain protein [Mycobacterium kansasii 824]|nr:phage integrase family domain protein [Mycobacterium kansasii 824]